MRKTTGLIAALLIALAPAAPALAQTGPATPGATDGGEVQDSGVGETDTAAWVGKPVLSAEGQAIGTLSSVQSASENSDGGTLLIAREGGAEVQAPLQGASFDGASVTVSVPMERIENPPAASAN